MADAIARGYSKFYADNGGTPDKFNFLKTGITNTQYSTHTVHLNPSVDLCQNGIKKTWVDTLC